MDYARVFAMSAAGMTVERTRVEVAAANLAHAQSAHHPAAAGYQPLRVVTQPLPAFADLLETSVPTAILEPQSVAPRLVQEPGHPLANEQGFVAYPGVDPATEMVSLMTAMRSYEANVAAMNTARTLAMKTLEIGRAG
ncbi:MAG: putative Flagellar basal-body rod protein FlgC [Ramlibacter sp.]|nr:putative Flagellar basal-body rod protein FlgC [Ramlibacter sp.]